MDHTGFLTTIESAFVPFLAQCGFSKQQPSIDGRHYSVDFLGRSHMVTLSYEPGDRAFFFYIFRRQPDGFSNIDDTLNTPRLADLNSRYMNSVSAADHRENDIFFRDIRLEDPDEKRLLKAAKDLRLVLPRYLQEESAQHQERPT